MPERMPKMSKGMPDRMSENMSDRMPDGMSENMSARTPDGMSDNMSARMQVEPVLWSRRRRHRRRSGSRCSMPWWLQWLAGHAIAIPRLQGVSEPNYGFDSQNINIIRLSCSFVPSGSSGSSGNQAVFARRFHI